MSTYSIAGLNVSFSPFGRTLKQAEKYLVADAAPDITIDFDEAYTERYMKKNGLDRDNAYYMLSGFYFYRKLIDFGGFMLHSSALEVDGKAYLFSGQCGIGKSTHTRHWQSLLGSKCRIINDDKPAVRVISGIPYAFGTPWSGKHDLNTPCGAPIGGICFVSRADTENKIETIDKKHAAMRILDQCTRGINEAQWDTLLSLIDKITDSVPVYLLHCINDISAAQLSYSKMIGEKI